MQDNGSVSEVMQIALRAREAAEELAKLDSSTRNAALAAMADALIEHSAEIVEANASDMARAKAEGMNPSLQDRLLLTDERIEGIASALRELVAENDPIGEVVEGRVLASGIQLSNVRVPLGVVAMIYEARPNVTADAAGLCIKTANACILRGGSAAIDTNLAMTRILSDAATAAGLPDNSIQSVVTTDRAATTELMGLHGLIDVLIPRGGHSLIQNCVENSKVPVIETGTGNCHVYVHESADVEMARSIIVNAKCQRPGVCNACESILVDASIAEEVLPGIISDMVVNGVVIHGDETALAVAAGMDLAEGSVVEGTEDDWGTEYLSLDVSIKTVSGIDEAISHIGRYGTKHSEAIVASDYDAVMRFTNEVDAAAVYANASTRFTDGGMFGLGAEIGIATQKLHARGPMGLSAMTTSKYILMGSGQIRC